ncbi:MAG: hypothetical protein EBU90_21320 [Proteobacteria bacterium]|nr:hypothetical protein [Pseudomonadota bacterium]NBP15959.1 hypothetical protein [bacterium]
MSKAIPSSEVERIVGVYKSEYEKLPNKAEVYIEQIFYKLIQDLLSEEIPITKGIFEGMRTRTGKLTSGKHVLNGTADNLLGKIVFELESNRKKVDDESPTQLAEYIGGLWEKQGNKKLPYIGVASDGNYTKKYFSKLRKNKVELEEFQTIEILKADPFDVYLFFRDLFQGSKRSVQGEILQRVLGQSSHVFAVIYPRLEEVWKTYRAESNFKVLFDSWKSYLKKVYSTEAVTEGLFLSHTYLVTVAKLICYRILKSGSSWDLTEIHKTLQGDVFKKNGILNLIESDFFCWIVKDEAWDLLKGSLLQLANIIDEFDWKDTSEDVLKPLYESLIDPETRRVLGEYYTPDWLAEIIIQDALKDNKGKRILDPSCGSGTFLQKAIFAKLQARRKTSGLIGEILNEVVGFDVNPVAVMIAKTNYLLSIQSLLANRNEDISIPVYLVDALRARTLELKGMHTDASLNMDVTLYLDEDGDKKQVTLKPSVLNRFSIYESLIDCSYQIAEFFKDQKSIDKDKAQQIVIKTISDLKHVPSDDLEEQASKNEAIDNIIQISEVLHYFIKNKRDSIWSYILKNRLYPILYSSWDRRSGVDLRFDAIVGNPPWITLKGLDLSFQEWLKKTIKEYKLLTSKDIKNITHLELATLFWLRCSDLYLKKNGTIRFVIPLSIKSSDQHQALRKGEYRFAEDTSSSLRITEFFNLNDVEPLFRVPSGVLCGQKTDLCEEKVPKEIPQKRFTGKLQAKNLSLKDAQSDLTIANSSLTLVHERAVWADKGDALQSIKGKNSFYHPFFNQGATLVPKPYWFIDAEKLKNEVGSRLGININCPPVQTDPKAASAAKGKNKGTILTGSVEKDFFHAVLTSKDVLPFFTHAPRLCILPVYVSKGALNEVSEIELPKFKGLKNWLDQAKNLKIEAQGDKADSMTLMERLNYQNALLMQDPTIDTIVVYNRSGSNVSCALVKPTVLLQRLRNSFINKTKKPLINPNSLVIDSGLYFGYLKNEDASHYLCAFLNSPFVNTCIKSLQSSGLGGPRDIHKKVLELPIPKYDAANQDHETLKQISQQMHNQLLDYETKYQAQKARGDIRKLQETALSQIDIICKKILTSS